MRLDDDFGSTYPVVCGSAAARLSGCLTERRERREAGWLLIIVRPRRRSGWNRTLQVPGIDPVTSFFVIAATLLVPVNPSRDVLQHRTAGRGSGSTTHLAHSSSVPGGDHPFCCYPAQSTHGGCNFRYALQCCTGWGRVIANPRTCSEDKERRHYSWCDSGYTYELGSW